jgi:hypothetical protein
MTRLAPFFLLPLILAGCMSPREMCEAEATRELRTIDGLIAETEGNIARGYALVPQTQVRERMVPCRHPDDAQFLFCFVPEVVQTDRPQAMDRAVERGRLASLRERRAELAGPSGRAVAACAAAYPEG